MEANTLKAGDSLSAGSELLSNNRRYCLSLQGDGNLVIYRKADGCPIWASGTVGAPLARLSMQHDGNLVIYAGHDPVYPVWASNTLVPGSFAVLTDLGELRIVEPEPAFRTVGGPDPEPLPAPIPGPAPVSDVPGANGQARFYGSRAVGDDDGPKLYVGLSRFAWLWFWKFDRDRVLRELDMDRKTGYRSGRVLAQVGDPKDPKDFWAGRIVDPDWPDYQELIAGLTNAAKERGHLIEWTLFGKGGPFDTAARRPDLVRRVAPVLAANPLGVLFGEAMNEPNVGNTITAGELRDLAALAKSLAPMIPWATGAVWTEPEWVKDTPYPDATGFTPEGWKKTQAAVGICHLDRDQSKSEMRDRPWRQGWDVGLESERWADNEAVGTGSTVTSESRPAVLRSHRTVAFICRAFLSNLHGKPGVRGDLKWEDEPAYAQAPKAIRFLPGDLANGSQENANPKYPNRPFTLDSRFVRADTGNRSGIVRAYSVFHAGVYYTVPFGPVTAFELRAERNLAVRCLQQDSGDLLWERDVAAGDVLSFDGSQPDYLLISRPR